MTKTIYAADLFCGAGGFGVKLLALVFEEGGDGENERLVDAERIV